MRSADWLCSRCSHQWPTTYSGMNTVTTSRGDSRRSDLTKSMIGVVISRNGESTIVNGTPMPRSSHSAWIARVSFSSTFTVTAVSVSGRVACAYASARSVGRCTLLTRTTAWLRDGSTGRFSGGTSSRATWS